MAVTALALLAVTALALLAVTALVLLAVTVRTLLAVTALALLAVTGRSGGRGRGQRADRPRPGSPWCLPDHRLIPPPTRPTELFKTDSSASNERRNCFIRGLTG